MDGSAREYHRITSYDRHATGGHFMDWYNQPDPFKSYARRQAIALPQRITGAEQLLSSLALEQPSPEYGTKISPETLARILVMSHAVTATARRGRSVFHFRSVASAGALYPFEMYVATAGVPGLGDGLFHHDVLSQGLTLLRSGNAVAEVRAALGAGEGGGPVLVFFLTSIFFRSSWKYRDRAYRYNLLDTGHLLENLALALRSERLPFEIYYDFDDARVNKLLCIDADREVCLALVQVRGSPDQGGGAALADPPGDLALASQVAAGDVAYPAIRTFHQLSSHLIGPGDGRVDMRGTLGLKVQNQVSIPEVLQWPEQLGYFDSVMKRRSMRNFVNKELPAQCFAAILKMLTSSALSGVSGDRACGEPLAVAFLAGNVEGLKHGLYLLDIKAGSFGLASRDVRSEELAYVCLNQSWLMNCAIHFLFLTNLEVLESVLGPRGYRHAMLEAGRCGQRIYLSATSMKLGCCGIGAFYDDEAARLLGLNNESRLLYLVAVGPVKKRSVT